jgi:hypothetical protein
MARSKEKPARLIGGVLGDKQEFPFGGSFSLNSWQEVGKESGRFHGRLKRNGLVFRQAHLCFERFAVCDFARAQNNRAVWSTSRSERSSRC